MNIELSHKDKFIKLREIIFIKVPDGKVFTRLERLIYNYVLFKLYNEKNNIIETINKHKEANLKFVGYVLDLSFSELYKKLELPRNKDALITAIENLRNIDINKEELTTFNFGRKNKRTYKSKLLGDFEYEVDDDSFFKIVISKNIIENIVLGDKKDYITMFMEDLIKFKEKYSLGLYEIINASYNPYFQNQNNQIKFFIEDIRNMLNIPKSYKIQQIRERVLDKSIKEINKETNFKIDYELSSADVGKTFKYITFTVNYKNEAKRKTYLENMKVKNIKDEEIIPILKMRNEKIENEELKLLKEELKEQAKQLEYYKKISNMAIDKADADYQETEEFKKLEENKFDFPIGKF